MSRVARSSRIQAASPLITGPDNADAKLPFGSSAILGSFVASTAAGAASRRRRGPVALRPRLSPGWLLSRCGNYGRALYQGCQANPGVSAWCAGPIYFPGGFVFFSEQPPTRFSLGDPGAPWRLGLFPATGPKDFKGGAMERTHLCRNRRQLRNTRDNKPVRKPNSHNTRVVCACLVSTPSVELRILSRKGCGFDSRRSHLPSSLPGAARAHLAATFPAAPGSPPQHRTPCPESS
jgi:hypothetical protein